MRNRGSWEIWVKKESVMAEFQRATETIDSQQFGEDFAHDNTPPLGCYIVSLERAFLGL